MKPVTRSFTKEFACAAAVAIGLGFGSVPSFANDEQVEQGRTFAQQECARCHAIGTEGDSPHKDAPPFRKIGEKYPVENLEEAFAEGIVVGHPDMPEFKLTSAQISALLSYIEVISR